MDQLIATGFHRCNVTTNEGGVIVEEVEAIYAKDRVDTTGSVFLGLTVGCATCHDHKFDPISQKDFYSLAAFFRNTTQNALDGNISDTPPVIVVPRHEDRTRWQQLKDEEGKLREQMTKVRNGSNEDFAKWLAEDARPKIPGPLDPADEVVSVSVAETAGIKFKNRPVTMDLPAGVSLGEGYIAGRKALRFEEKSGLELPNVDLFAVDRPFTISAWVLMPKGDDSFVVVSQTDRRASIAVGRSNSWAADQRCG